ncbi:efflux RND transporter permease subunit, partial [Mesorhizobium sp. M00.F.Ca.ET.149.01.1.1]
ADRSSISTLQNLQLPTGTGESIPLAAIANFRYDLEQPTVWRRNRTPTITVRAGLVGDVLPATVVNELKPSVDGFIAKLPPGYSVETAGSVEESAKSQGPIAAVVPLML